MSGRRIRVCSRPPAVALPERLFCRFTPGRTQLFCCCVRFPLLLCVAIRVICALFLFRPWICRCISLGVFFAVDLSLYCQCRLSTRNQLIGPHSRQTTQTVYITSAPCAPLSCADLTRRTCTHANARSLTYGKCFGKLSRYGPSTAASNHSDAVRIYLMDLCHWIGSTAVM